MWLSGDAYRRTALGEAQRVALEAPRCQSVAAELRAAVQQRARIVAQKGRNDRHDGVAMREQPAREREDDGNDRAGAENRRRQAQKQRTAEGRAEVAHRSAVELAVNPLHSGNGRAARDHRKERVADGIARAQTCTGEARAISGGDFAAAAQPACRQKQRDEQCQAADEDSRPVREVVVAIVRERKVADDVNGGMRQRRPGRSRAKSKRTERSKSDAHARALRRPRLPSYGAGYSVSTG